MAGVEFNLEDLREQVAVQELLAEYNALVAQNRLAQFENSIVQEAFNSPIDPRERYYDEPDFYPISTQINSPYFYTEVDDRECGQFRPLFESEHDLNVIRAQSNRIVWFDELGIGALNSLKSYIFQKGLKFVPSSVIEGMDAVVEEMKELIEHILHINGYRKGLDREYHDRARIDGEVLTELRWNEDVLWHEHEPQYLTEPDEESQRRLENWRPVLNVLEGESDWKFGVLTHKRETAIPLGYHLIFDKEGMDWDWVPAEQMVHYKRNVWRSTKRGISDFLQVVRDLERDSKLTENMVLGAALQAAIAWIVEYPEGSKVSSIQNAVTGTADYRRQVQQETGSKSVPVNKIRPGTIPHLRKGAGYKEPPFSKGGPTYIMVSQHIRRTLGVRFSMPEFMISGDASNGNYSSTTVTHDSFVKARQDDQMDFGNHGAELLWKSLKMYHDRGKFASGKDWEDIKRSVRITPEGMDPSTKSPLEKRQGLAIEVDYGWTAPETAAAEVGRHHKEEVAKGAERAPSPNMEAEQNMSGKRMSEGLVEAWRNGGY